MTTKLTFKGRLFQMGDPQIREQTYEEIIEKLRERIKDTVSSKFQRSTELAAYIGQSIDPEATRAILRSVNIEIRSRQPLKFGVRVFDTLGHWYGMEETPQELSDMVEGLVVSAIEDLNRSGEMRDIVVRTLRGG
jgi:hypothetical protein